MLNSLIEICIDCIMGMQSMVLTFALCMFALWLLQRFSESTDERKIDRGMLPRPPSDLPVGTSAEILQAIYDFFLKKVTKPIVAVTKRLNYFHISTFYKWVSWLLFGVKWFYNQHGNGWDYLRIFIRSLVFYLIIIPLPAAFLAPVGRAQIHADWTLLYATLLLILANAIADMFSVKLTIINYQRAVTFAQNASVLVNQESSNDSHSAIESMDKYCAELKFYVMTALDLLYASALLMFVLMVSNVLYGVQVGEYGLDVDPHTLGLMWERATHFCDVRHQLYWMRGDDEGFWGYSGIPGMLLFGITTYIPTLFIGLSALVWMFLLPVRILFTMARGSLKSLLASEFAVITYCVFGVTLASVDYIKLYGLLITK